MKRKRFTEEQIVAILKEAAGSDNARLVVRQHGITETTFYRWKVQYGGMGLPAVKRLKSLEDHWRVLGVVLVPRREARLATPGDRERGYQHDVHACVHEMERQRPMVPARRLRPHADERRLPTEETHQSRHVLEAVGKPELPAPGRCFHEHDMRVLRDVDGYPGLWRHSLGSPSQPRGGIASHRSNS